MVIGWGLGRIRTNPNHNPNPHNNINPNPHNLNSPNPFHINSRSTTTNNIPPQSPFSLDSISQGQRKAAYTQHNPYLNANLKLSLRPFDNIVLNTYHNRNLDPFRSIQRKLFIYTQPALTHNEFCEALVSIILVETPKTELAKLTADEQLKIFPNQRRYSLMKTTTNQQSQQPSQHQQQQQERIHFGICPCLNNNPKIEFKLLPLPTTSSPQNRIPPSPNQLDPNLTSSVFYIHCAMSLSDQYPDLAVTNQCTSFSSPYRRLVSFAHNLVHDPLSLAWAMMRALQSRATVGPNGERVSLNLQVHIDELLPNAP